MFTQAGFWQCFGLSALAMAVGMVVAAIIAVLLKGNKSRQSNKQFETDLAIGCGLILFIAFVTLLITLPITHWFEICLVAFGVAGFAGRWIGVTLARFIADKYNGFEDWMAFAIIYLAPTVIVGFLVGLSFWQVL